MNIDRMIPAGWQFYQLDASVEGKCRATLKRDRAGYAAWCELGRTGPEEEFEACSLFAEALGSTPERALRAAVQQAINGGNV